jgi:DNA-binding NtrC family response regulator/tetratricopeptide (TPR) repeat protein
MAFSLEQVTGLITSGRFRDAVSELQKAPVRPGDPHHDTYVSVLAEALQLTGQIEDAQRVAQQAVKARGARQSSLARCHLVLGNISRDRGDFSRSVSHFERAFHLSEDSPNPEMACWARLRLMMVAGEIDGPEAAISMLPEIRRRVSNLGSPVVLATLHLWVAEFETKRGLLGSACRHIQMGRAILSRHENVWLEGSAAIDDFCVAFLRSDVRSAFTHASTALSAAALSGHAATRMAACTNLAHIHLAYGELDIAANYFDQARECCHSGGAGEVAVLDGLAQLELARLNFPKCEEYLQHIETLATTTRSTVPRYYQSWSFRTKLHLLVTQRRTNEAHEFIQSYQPIFSKFHPSLRIGLNRLHAELFLLTNDFQAASCVLSRAYADYDGQSPEASAYLSLTIGKTLIGLERPYAAAFHLKRSVRIFTHLRQVSACNEASALLSRILAAETVNGSNHSGRSAASQRSETKELLTRNQQEAHILDRIKGLIELEGPSELLGQEVFELLRELNCMMSVTLVKMDRQRQQILARWCDSPSSLVTSGHTIGEDLNISIDQTNDLAILATPRPDVAARLECAAISKVVSGVIELRNFRREAEERHAIWPPDEFVPIGEAIFCATPMVEMLTTLRKIAPSNLTVLITGETGTGKEVFARTLHEHSKRSGKVFTAFNCAAVPRDLIESQLFGYRRGSFSGANDHFEGVIRAASGGSLFLDEIGDVPHEVQPKLLRFLESGEVHPLGEPRPLKPDVRVIAATNANLEQKVAEGVFREDLFYRLNVIRFRMPPLRERREEISILVQHFLGKYCNEYLKTDLCVSESLMECFSLYHWPGNIRQLANEMRRLVVLAESGSILDVRQLSPEVAGGATKERETRKPHVDDEVTVRLNQPLNAAIVQLERAMLGHALKTSGWRLEAAATALGLSRKGLYLKRIRLGVLD